ncbi:MAG TPA: hypothetical protein DCM86_04335 [Verrucomicrobiales bacterium]|nr:hypothetical protein [Verrucomicrobiales bacterium]
MKAKLALILATLCALALTTSSAPEPGWKGHFLHRLPELGHRNWIVIADAAYPSQVGAGIETIPTGGDQLEVVQGVLDAISRHGHVRPIVWTDSELPHVAENDAPGIGGYRNGLASLLVGRQTFSQPHEAILNRLSEAGQTYHVVVLKTRMALPYTSVFLELDCGYWTPDAEKRLRALMGAGAPRNP